MNFASMLFGTTQLPNYPVTRHVRLANLPMKFRIEERINKQAKEARQAKAQQTPKERRAEQLEKAREVRSAKCEAANRVSAKDYVGNGKFTQRAYAYMNKVYPRWITSEELVGKTGINKSTVSIIFYNMNGRGHLDKMKQSGKGRLRFKLYRLVLE